MNFKNKKILIMGLGLHGGGVSSAKFFASQKAIVTVTDLRDKKYLKNSLEKLKKFKIKYILGKHQEKDFLNNDLIIKNPGVPNDSFYLKIAQKNKIPIETDINIFFKLAKGYIIGVTGTKGKTTVCHLIYHILKKKNVFLGGNLGTSPLEFVSKLNSKSLTILELSSFALENTEYSPNLAIITNIYPDHLNRYKNMKDYIEAKKRIFKFQEKNDILILNYDTPCLKKIPALFFSENNKKVDCYSQNNEIFYQGKRVCQTSLLNALPAVLTAKLLKVSSKKIQQKINTFKGVAHRQELITEKEGIKYINDTASTMPHSTIKAIKRFSPNLILIAGGENKGLKYQEMAQEIKKNVKYLILLKGSATNELKKYLKNYFIFSNMKEAVKKAKKLAQKGDIILLSPGAASFNLFKNEFDRGGQFKKEI